MEIRGGGISNPQKIYNTDFDTSAVNVDIPVTSGKTYVMECVSSRNGEVYSITGGDIIAQFQDTNGAQYGRGGYYSTVYSYVIIFKATSSTIRLSTSSGYNYAYNCMLIQLD